MGLSLGISENHGPEGTSPYCLNLFARKFGFIHQTVVPGSRTILPFYILILLPLLECSSNNASCPPDCSLQTWWTKIGEMDSGRCDMYNTNFYGRGQDWTTNKAQCSLLCDLLIRDLVYNAGKDEVWTDAQTIFALVYAYFKYVCLKEFTYALSYLSTEIYKQ